jgi:DNA-binding Lrp family transcriptional regulator
MKAGLHMDWIDKKIIEILLADANMPLYKVADIIGIPRPTVYARFNKLVEGGIVKGFGLILGSKPNGELKGAILKVKSYLLSEMGPRVMKRLGEKLASRSEVKFAAKLSYSSIFVVWEGDSFKPDGFEEVIEVEMVETEIFKGD